MILSGHQPVYLPGIILFNKIALSDAFMFVGHCQYESGSWQNRNQIRTGRLTVPVKHAFGQSINDAALEGDHWRRKHLRAIELCYGSAPFFKRYFPELAEIISGSEKLSDLNCRIIIACLSWLDIKTKILFSEDYGIGGAKTDMLICMCKRTGADSYLSNEGSRAYVDEAKMAEAGVTHCWQKFTPSVYEQGKPFIADLSVIDLLFNCGPESGTIVRSCGHVG